MPSDLSDTTRAAARSDRDGAVASHRDASRRNAIRRFSIVLAGTRRLGARHRRSERGQSLVEFALVLPMLLVLLLGIADMGRVFSAGITMEAAARNGAEAAAQEYVQLVRNKPSGTLDAGDYAHLHKVALDTVCREAEVLPNAVSSGSGCSMPAAAVCVHDGSDLAGCGSEADASLTDCDALNGGWNGANAGPDPGGTGPLVYVEVRVCYQFTTLLNLSNLRLPLGWSISIGDIWLEHDREFTVACYPQASGPCS